MKKILVLTIFLGIFLLAGKAGAIDLIIKDYPTIGDATLSNVSTLPDLIRYIYLFAFAISGLVAFASIVIAGVKYLTSAGNSSKMDDAKDQITSALLGLLILFLSVMILRTINPDLVSLDFVLPEAKSCYCYDYMGEETFKGCIENNCQNECSKICPKGGICRIDKNCE